MHGNCAKSVATVTVGGAAGGSSQNVIITSGADVDFDTIWAEMGLPEAYTAKTDITLVPAVPRSAVRIVAPAQSGATVQDAP